jgi:ribosomal protein L11 methyltransferase
MRSLGLRVAPGKVEEVLDVILPLVPNGVHELPGERDTELLIFGSATELPKFGELRRLFGERLLAVSERTAPEDWRERRLLTYRPRVIAGRLAVRPDWAPPPSVPIDIVLGDERSFGSGGHPTTHACLELLAAIEVWGSVADLGCGSGVLAIAAAVLGFSPVLAVDADPAALSAASANAARNGIDIPTRRVDLTREAPPGADLVLANLPIAVHTEIATGLATGTARVVASGVPADGAEALIGAYRAAGMTATNQRIEGGWAAVSLERR